MDYSNGTPPVNYTDLGILQFGNTLSSINLIVTGNLKLVKSVFMKADLPMIFSVLGPLVSVVVFNKLHWKVLSLIEVTVLGILKLFRALQYENAFFSIVNVPSGTVECPLPSGLYRHGVTIDIVTIERMKNSR